MKPPRHDPAYYCKFCLCAGYIDGYDIVCCQIGVLYINRQGKTASLPWENRHRAEINKLVKPYVVNGKSTKLYNAMIKIRS